MAGPGFPIVPCPDDRTITASTAVGSFGSQHKGGLCLFALEDGSVREIDPGINTILLGYLFNIRDGQVIPDY